MKAIMAPTDSPRKGKGGVNPADYVHHSSSLPSVVKKKGKLGPLSSMTDTSLLGGDNGDGRSIKPASAIHSSSLVSLGRSFRLKGKYTLQRKGSKNKDERIAGNKGPLCGTSSSVHADMPVGLQIKRERKDVARRIKYFRSAITRGLTFRRKKTHTITCSKSFENIPAAVSKLQPRQRRRFQSADFLSDEIPLSPRVLAEQQRLASLNNNDEVVSDDDDLFDSQSFSKNWTLTSYGGDAGEYGSPSRVHQRPVSTGAWGGWGVDESDDSPPTAPKSKQAPMKLKDTSRAMSMNESVAAPAAPQKPHLLVQKSASYTGNAISSAKAPEKLPSPLARAPLVKQSRAQQPQEEEFESDDDDFNIQGQKGAWDSSWRAASERTPCDDDISHSELEDVRDEPEVSDWAGWGDDSDDETAANTLGVNPRTSRRAREDSFSKLDAAGPWSPRSGISQCSVNLGFSLEPTASPQSTIGQSPAAVSKTPSNSSTPTDPKSSIRPAQALPRAQSWEERADTISPPVKANTVQSKCHKPLNSTSSVPYAPAATTAAPQVTGSVRKSNSCTDTAPPLQVAQRSPEKPKSPVPRKPSHKQTQPQEETFESDDDEFDTGKQGAWGGAWGAADDTYGDGDDAADSEGGAARNDEPEVSDWAGWGSDSD